jgi:hypothetical protein
MTASACLSLPLPASASIYLHVALDMTSAFVATVVKLRAFVLMFVTMVLVGNGAHAMMFSCRDHIYRVAVMVEMPWCWS